MSQGELELSGKKKKVLSKKINSQPEFTDYYLNNDFYFMRKFTLPFDDSYWREKYPELIESTDYQSALALSDKCSVKFPRKKNLKKLQRVQTITLAVGVVFTFISFISLCGWLYAIDHHGNKCLFLNSAMSWFIFMLFNIIGVVFPAFIITGKLDSKTDYPYVEDSAHFEDILNLEKRILFNQRDIPKIVDEAFRTNNFSNTVMHNKLKDNPSLAMEIRNRILYIDKVEKALSEDREALNDNEIRKIEKEINNKVEQLCLLINNSTTEVKELKHKELLSGILEKEEVEPRSFKGMELPQPSEKQFFNYPTPEVA